MVVDYGVKQNPLLEEAQLKEEKTIEEMQPTVFDIKYYEYVNEQKKMYYYPEPSQHKQPGFLVEGKEFEGLGLRKEQVVEHIRELRSLGYQILNSLTTGN